MKVLEGGNDGNNKASERHLQYYLARGKGRWRIKAHYTDHSSKRVTLSEMEPRLYVKGIHIDRFTRDKHRIIRDSIPYDAVS